MFFLVSVEMLNYTGLATVQGGRIGPVCLFGSVVCIGVQSGCGQVHVGFLQRKNCLLLVVSVKLAVKKEASVKDIFVGRIRRLRCDGFSRSVKNGSLGPE